jgi:hypothetical protein
MSPGSRKLIVQEEEEKQRHARQINQKAEGKKV